MSFGAERAAVRAEAARLEAHLVAAGAEPVDVPILVPAGPLLDLYGEDIRARAFTTTDPLRGEMMLRPDFTVPVVELHMAEGANPARYAYAGPVFRRQEADPERPAEYLQVGYELFGGDDPAAADAEVFTLFADVLAPLGLRAVAGDMGLLRAAVAGLDLSARRRAALMRHLWRPARFRALLERFTGRRATDPARAALLAAADAFAEAGPAFGRRSRDEVEARLAALAEDAAEPPLAAEAAERVERLLALSGPAPELLPELEALADGNGALGAAVARYGRRLDALAARGIDPAGIAVETSFGRTALEYYDGFVFGFTAPGRDDLPPVATGGRYDALTAALGGGRGLAAVGGVIRPALTLALGAGR